MYSKEHEQEPFDTRSLKIQTCLPENPDSFIPLQFACSHVLLMQIRETRQLIIISLNGIDTFFAYSEFEMVR